MADEAVVGEPRENVQYAGAALAIGPALFILCNIIAIEMAKYWPRQRRRKMTDEEFYIELHGAAVWAMVLAVEEVRKNMGDLD